MSIISDRLRQNAELGYSGNGTRSSAYDGAFGTQAYNDYINNLKEYKPESADGFLNNMKARGLNFLGGIETSIGGTLQSLGQILRGNADSMPSMPTMDINSQVGLWDDINLHNNDQSKTTSGWQQLADSMINEGKYLGDTGQKLTRKYGTDAKWDDKGILELLTDPEYMNPLNAKGISGDIINAAGTSVPALATSVFMPELAVGSALAKVGGGVVSKYAPKVASSIMEHGASKGIAKFAENALNEGLNFGVVNAITEASADSAENIEEYKKQASDMGLKGKDVDKYVSDKLQEQIGRELPALLASDIVTGSAIKGKLFKGTGGNDKLWKRALKNGGATLIDASGEYLTESGQQRIGNEMTGKPYGTWYDPTEEEARAGRKGFFGSGGMTAPASIYNTLFDTSDLAESGTIDTDLVGKTMENGRNGCVEAVRKIGDEHGISWLANAGTDYVPTLVEKAEADGILIPFDESKLQAGDVIVYGDNDHVVMYDGAGGYVGNSTSQNMVVHGEDYTDMGRQAPTKIIKTGTGGFTNPEGNLMDELDWKTLESDDMDIEIQQAQNDVSASEYLEMLMQNDNTDQATVERIAQALGSEEETNALAQELGYSPVQNEEEATEVEQEEQPKNQLNPHDVNVVNSVLNSNEGGVRFKTIADANAFAESSPLAKFMTRQGTMFFANSDFMKSKVVNDIITNENMDASLYSGAGRSLDDTEQAKVEAIFNDPNKSSEYKDKVNNALSNGDFDTVRKFIEANDRENEIKAQNQQAEQDFFNTISGSNVADAVRQATDNVVTDDINEAKRRGFDMLADGRSLVNEDGSRVLAEQANNILNGNNLDAINRLNKVLAGNMVRNTIAGEQMPQANVPATVNNQVEPVQNGTREQARHQTEQTETDNNTIDAEAVFDSSESENFKQTLNPLERQFMDYLDNVFERTSSGFGAVLDYLYKTRSDIIKSKIREYRENRLNDPRFEHMPSYVRKAWNYLKQVGEIQRGDYKAKRKAEGKKVVESTYQRIKSANKTVDNWLKKFATSEVEESAEYKQVDKAVKGLEGIKAKAEEYERLRRAEGGRSSGDGSENIRAEYRQPIIDSATAWGNVLSEADNRQIVASQPSQETSETVEQDESAQTQGQLNAPTPRYNPNEPTETWQNEVAKRGEEQNDEGRKNGNQEGNNEGLSRINESETDTSEGRNLSDSEVLEGQTDSSTDGQSTEITLNVRDIAKEVKLTKSGVEVYQYLKGKFSELKTKLSEADINAGAMFLAYHADTVCKIYKKAFGIDMSPMEYIKRFRIENKRTNDNSAYFFYNYPWNAERKGIRYGRGTNSYALFHEFGHLIWNDMLYMAKDPNCPKIIKEDMRKIIEWINGKPFSMEQLEQYVKDWHSLMGHNRADKLFNEEQLAQGMVWYIRRGKTPIKALNILLDGIRDMLLKFIKMFQKGWDKGSTTPQSRRKNSNWWKYKFYFKMPNEIKEVYDRMLYIDDRILDNDTLGEENSVQNEPKTALASQEAQEAPSNEPQWETPSDTSENPTESKSEGQNSEPKAKNENMLKGVQIYESELKDLQENGIGIKSYKGKLVNGKPQYDIEFNSQEDLNKFYDSFYGESEDEEFDYETKFSATPKKMSFAGEKAETAPLDTLEKAKDMDEEGYSRQAIYEKTGWFKGKDNRWRFEIPDDLDKINLDILTDEPIALSEVYDNEALYSAYPELENILVAKGDLGSDYGNFDGNTITLNEKYFDKEEAEVKKTVIHELQHAIQRIEDFAKGGSSGDAMSFVNQERDRLIAFLFGESVLDSFSAKKSKWNKLDKLMGKLNSKRKGAAEKAKEDIKALVEYSSLSLDTITKTYNQLKDIDNALSEIRQKAYARQGDEMYYRLGGEQESRAVEARANNRSLEKEYSKALQEASSETKDQLKEIEKLYNKKEAEEDAKEVAKLEKSIESITGKIKDKDLLTKFWLHVIAKNSSDHIWKVPEPHKADAVIVFGNKEFSARASEAIKAQEGSGTTQVATTRGMYIKALAYIRDSVKKDAKTVLDYGAGLGLGTDDMREANPDMKVDSYEVNPERWQGKEPPTFTKSNDIKGKYDVVICANVVNVLEKPIRDMVVQDIADKLNNNGVALITARGWTNDVANAKNFRQSDEEHGIWVKKTSKGQTTEVFQKGFTQSELREYVQNLLGDNFIVVNNSKFGKAGVIVTKTSANNNKYSRSNPNSAENLKKFGNTETQLDKLPKVDYTKLNKGEKAIQNFGKTLGIPVHFVTHPDTGYRGVFTHNGEIFINRNSTVPVKDVFIHEFVHWLKASENEAIFDSLSACLENLNGVSHAKRLSAYRQSIFNGQEMTDSEIIEEMICDAISHTETADKLFKAMEDINHSTASKVLGFMKNLWDKLCEATGYNPNKAVARQELPNRLDASEMAKINATLNKHLLNLKGADGNSVFIMKNGKMVLRDNNKEVGEVYNTDAVTDEVVTEPTDEIPEPSKPNDGTQETKSTDTESMVNKATKDLLRKMGVNVQADDNVSVQRKEDGKQDISSISRWINSPSFMARYNKLLAPFVVMAKQAVEKQEKLRYQFREALNDVEKILGYKNIGKNDPKYKENKEALNSVLINGDLEQKEYTDAELRKAGYNEQVIQAYKKMRKLLNDTWEMLNDVNSRMKVGTRNLTDGELLDLKKKNPFLVITNESSERDANGRKRYTYKYPTVDNIVENLTSQELSELRKNSDVKVVETEKLAGEGYKVTYVQRRRMGKIKGYVPHMFHEWAVVEVDKNGNIIKDENGNSKFLTTFNNMNDAVKYANKQDKSKNYKVMPKLHEVAGASERSMIVEDKHYLTKMANVVDNFTLTPEEAVELMNSGIKAGNRGRFLGNLMKRKGVKGYEQDMLYATYQYLNQAGRYIALDPFKRLAYSLYEKQFGKWGDERVYSGELGQSAKWARTYINAVNGVPTNVEQSINNALHSLGIGKDVAGGRPAIWLAHAMTYPITICKLGVCNVSSALLNITQLCNLFGAMGDMSVANTKRIINNGAKNYWIAWNNPKSEMGKLLWDDLGLRTQLGMDITGGYSRSEVNGLGSLQGAVSKLAGASMFMFRGTDSFGRGVSLLTAYQKAIEEGKTKAEAIRYAKTINDRVNFDYSVADANGLYQRLGVVANVMFQFKKYPIKQLELFYDIFKEQRNNNIMKGVSNPNARAVLSLMKFMTPYMAMSGIAGVPFISLVSSLIGLFDDDDRELVDKIRAWTRNTFGEDNPIVNAFNYGALGSIGINAGSRIGVGDFLGDSGMKQTRTEMLLGTFSTLFSTGFQVVNQLVVNGNYAESLKALNPSLGNLWVAANGEVRTTRGRLKYKYQDNWERFVRILGFTPVGESLSSEQASEDYYIRKQEQAEKKAAIDEFIAYPTAENASKLNELGITPKSIQTELERRGKTRHQINTEQEAKKQETSKKKKPKTYSANDYLRGK